MRTANITAGVALIIWLALFYMGRGGTYDIYAHGRGVFPGAGQIDYYIVFPICVAAGIGAVGWICNGTRRAQPLLAASVVSLIAVFPYLMGYAGGM